MVAVLTLARIRFEYEGAGFLALKQQRVLVGGEEQPYPATLTHPANPNPAIRLRANSLLLLR